MAMSFFVQVGDLNMTVSESMAAAISPPSWARCDPVLLIHGGYDGVRLADRLISDGDGLAGLDIGEAVVVDYLKYLNLIQPVHGLRGLVVIHEHDALALQAQQVEARQRSHNVVVLVQNRIAAVAALQHQLAHVIKVIGQVEADDVSGLADVLDRHRLEDEPTNAPRVERWR